MKKLHKDPFLLALFEAGEGEPLLLLHGQMSTHLSLQNLAHELAKTRHVYMVDLLGYGSSPRPARAEYSVQQHVDSIYKTIQENGLTLPLTVVGNSMGAQLAIALAKRYPDAVKNLVVTALPLFDNKEVAYQQMGDSDPRIRWVLKGKRARLLRSLPKFFERPLGWYALKLNNGVYPPEDSREAVRNRWPAFHRSMENVVIGYEPGADIAAVGVPLHFIFGDHDTLNPNASQKLHKYLKANHTLEVVAGNHHIPQEHTELIVKRVHQV